MSDRSGELVLRRKGSRRDFFAAARGADSRSNRPRALVAGLPQVSEPTRILMPEDVEPEAELAFAELKPVGHKIVARHVFQIQQCR